ncbi:6-phosphogluconate dehydrogenase [Lancefieldella rimae]|uniref:Phosphogluconate dehydrogenase (Decarboxylating) n=3 Tax=Lancefieldella rimae TaxID=1383 RepID=B9CM65_LANR4|nr:phosphogluconate dehydrogenase (decarboxylating) [Lancefieldella rimae ATCC 49626]KRO02364.1 6-phosphogluconate dehydrogenase [Lancefieldella rimae]
MRIGLVGLGKMGYNLALNLKDNGHEVIGFDLSKEARAAAEKDGVATAASISEQIGQLATPRVLWLMVPSGAATQAVIDEALDLLESGDVLIDAGNSNYKDSVRHGDVCAKKGVAFLDVGTSGGTSGARYGACLMIGGDQKAYDLLSEVFDQVSCEDGCTYVGPAGAGHFMKMVHNGVEYGMMEAIGEGFAIMREAPFDYDLAAVAKNWNHGSVVRSWLMELAEVQLAKHPDLSDIKGIVAASGEAKWTVEAALAEEVPAPVIAQALFERNASQMGEENFSNKMVSALRNGFGGHAIVNE